MLNKKKLLGMLLVFVLMFSVIGAGCSAEDAAANYPEKPLNFMVWGSPGGGSDIFGRTLGKAAEPYFGEPIVVENKPGGGGATAMAEMSQKDPDGYSVLAVTTNLVLTPLTKDTPNSYEDFDPIIMIGTDATMIVAQADGEFQSVEDVLEIGKERTLKWGTFGIGTTDHVAAALLVEMSGIDVDFVPFDGGGEAMASLLGGHIDLLNGNPSEVATQIEADQLIGVGIFSEERLEKYNEVPTLKEKGYDILVETWRGIVAPKGTPQEIKDKLFDSFSKALEEDEMVEYFDKNDISKNVKNGSEFLEFIESQHNFFQETLTEMGII